MEMKEPESYLYFSSTDIASLVHFRPYHYKSKLHYVHVLEEIVIPVYDTCYLDSISYQYLQ